MVIQRRIAHARGASHYAKLIATQRAWHMAHGILSWLRCGSPRPCVPRTALLHALNFWCTCMEVCEVHGRSGGFGRVVCQLGLACGAPRSSCVFMRERRETRTGRSLSLICTYLQQCATHAPVHVRVCSSRPQSFFCPCAWFVCEGLVLLAEGACMLGTGLQRRPCLHGGELVLGLRGWPGLAPCGLLSFMYCGRGAHMLDAHGCKVHGTGSRTHRTAAHAGGDHMYDSD